MYLSNICRKSYYLNNENVISFSLAHTPYSFCTLLLGSPHIFKYTCWYWTPVPGANAFNISLLSKIFAVHFCTYSLLSWGSLFLVLGFSPLFIWKMSNLRKAIRKIRWISIYPSLETYSNTYFISYARFQ